MDDEPNDALNVKLLVLDGVDEPIQTVIQTITSFSRAFEDGPGSILQ